MLKFYRNKMAADVLSPAVYSGAGNQTGYPCVKLQGGLQFTGQQQSKGNSYRVDVFVQVDSKETVTHASHNS